MDAMLAGEGVVAVSQSQPDFIPNMSKPSLQLSQKCVLEPTN